MKKRFVKELLNRKYLWLAFAVVLVMVFGALGGAKAYADNETCEHVWVETDNDGEAVFTCSVCGESFTLYYYTNFVDGTISINGCGNNDQILVIPDTIAGNDVTGISGRAFYECTNLISVTIPESVVSIGDNAFYDCINLTTADIPAGVKTIGTCAFCNCSKLERAVIPQGVTKLESHTFSGCTGLTSITLQEGLVTIGDNAFNCCGINEISIPNTVTILEASAFCNCSSLSSISIPDSVTEIGGSAFYNCSSLKDIMLPKNVTSIKTETFKNCSSLTSVTIPEGVTSIGASAFYYCTGLTDVTIPESVTSIGSDAFYWSNSIIYAGTACKFEKILSSNSIGTVKIECLKGDAHSFNKGVVNSTDHIVTYTCSECGRYYSLNYVIDNNECGVSLGETDLSTPVTVTVPSKINNVKVISVISDQDYWKGTSLTGKTAEIILPNTVTEIGNSAFYYCAGLKTIKIPDGVESIGSSAFSGCTSLKSIELSDNITSIGYSAFNGCTSLETIKIPDSLTYINDSCFSGCTGLKKVEIPNSVTRIDYYAFKGCTSLTDIKLPASVQYIGGTAFADCSNLKSITISKSVKSIGDNAIGMYYSTLYSEYRPISDFVVYGYKYSQAETYAKNNGLTFVALDMKSERICGDTRYDTAIESAETLKTVLDVKKFACIVVASGVNFPDALAGSPLASQKNAPILLVGSNDASSSQKVGTTLTIEYVKNNLEKGGTVYILGGTSAVSAATEKALKAIAGSKKVKRLYGDLRYDTNMAIINEMTIPEGTDVVIVQGYTSYKNAADKAAKKNPQGYADSLSVSGAAGALGMPIFLANTTGLTKAQQEKIQSIKPAHIYVIGGESAVSGDVYRQMEDLADDIETGTKVQRIAGTTRYETSVAIAKTFGLDKTESAVVAYGQNFPDGLTGGVLAAKLGAPLLLAESGKTSVQQQFIANSTVSKLYILGGTTVLPDDTVSKLMN